MIKEWFETHGNAIRIIETPILPVYEQALQDEISGRNRHATRGLGDAAFGWLLPNLDLVVRRGMVPLVLTEDRNLSMTLANEQVAHILSTRAWLLGLENAGIIESAGDVMEMIGRHGRMLSVLPVDLPVAAGDDITDWIDAAKRGMQPRGDG